ncbi:MAG TPA: hypothetical protein VLG16_00955 [Candidatus Saccharimonadales bacterium]|nr:hypothetical protein [Candidatus Saccharimonadales bacterium]
MALTVLEAIWGPDYTKTFSRLVARRRFSIVYYFVVFSIFLVFFSFFVLRRLVPKLQLSNLFVIVYLVGAICQFICVAVPEIKGLMSKVHVGAATIMSASALAQVGGLALAAHLAQGAFIVCLASGATMVAIWIFFITKATLAKYELVVQAIYFICYLTAVLAASAT